MTKYGYQGRPPIHVRPEDAWGTSTYKQGVVFTSPNVVAAFFIVHGPSSGVTSEQSTPLPSDSYRLVAVFLDADKGGLIKQLDWALPSTSQSLPEPIFFPATKGQFVVGVGNMLYLYSPDFKIVARHSVRGELEAVVSPSGKTVLIQDTRLVSRQWSQQSDLLDTDGLNVLKSWQSGPQMNEILWGDEIASMMYQSVSIRTPDTPARPLISGKQWLCGGWSFVNKDALGMLECGSAEKLSLVSTDGKVLYQFDLGLEQHDGPIIASQNGRRFALPTRHWGSGRNLDPEKLIARVFDIDIDKPILTIDVAPHYGHGPNFETPEGDTRFGWGGLALSPDSQLLAVKSGPIVSLYRLPESAVPADASDHSGAASSQPAPSQRKPHLVSTTGTTSPKVIEQVLSWLPADTQTLIAASGAFSLTSLMQGERDTGAKNTKESDDIAETFTGFPLGQFGFDNGLLGKYFKTEKILFALEGSQNFRMPAGLGEGPFEGCNIAIFGENITAPANSFMDDSVRTAARIEEIEGHKVAVFREKKEKDLWTTFVTFPLPNVAIAATNENYLREVLARIGGKHGDRALPDSLPEWNYVNRQAAFWAVRHYTRSGATIDPTSPFARRPEFFADDRAIGLVFMFDPRNSKTATITYLSTDQGIFPVVQEHLFPFQSEAGVREMHIRYREVTPGVIEGSYELQHIESAEIFAFGLSALLGHTVAL